MYDKMRKDLAVELRTLPAEQLQRVLRALDNVAARYEVSEREMALATTGDHAAELIQRWLVCRKVEGQSDLTLNADKIKLVNFFDRIGKSPEHVKTDDIRAYLVLYQKERRVADNTLDKVRQAINVFFKWMVEEEYLDKNPCAKIKRIKGVDKPKKPLDRESLERVRIAGESMPLRDRVILEILYSTGCRAQELYEMLLEDINWSTGEVQVLGKGKKYRTVILNDRSKLMLKQYIDSRTDINRHVIVGLKEPHKSISVRSVENVIAKYAKTIEDAGLYLTPHTLRRTCGTMIIEGTGNLSAVQQYLGHASPSTTQRYAKATQDTIARAHELYVL